MSELSLNIVSIIAKCSTIPCTSKREHKISEMTPFLNFYYSCLTELENFFFLIDSYGKKLLKAAYYCSKYH